MEYDKNWYKDLRIVFKLAKWLHSNSYIEEISNLLYFLAEPEQWDEEYKEYLKENKSLISFS